MRKIPTLFERDWDGDRSLVLPVYQRDCAWVADGEGTATRKLDGTCCMVAGGVLFRRRELKPGQIPPPSFIPIGETGKTVGWVFVEDGPEDRYHNEAWASAGYFLPDGTYELVGPKIQGNPENYIQHMLVRHGSEVLEGVPRDFDGLRNWLAGKDIEGIVWHHPDGRMAKIKLRDFGIVREAAALSMARRPA